MNTIIIYSCMDNNSSDALYDIITRGCRKFNVHSLQFHARFASKGVKYDRVLT